MEKQLLETSEKFWNVMEHADEAGMRCVVNCPKGARKINPVILAGVGMMLQKVCADRKSCELFL